MILLTTETGFLKPIAWVFGKIIDLLFTMVSAIPIKHLPVLALVIILFTIIVRLIMLPLTIKQQKFSKLSNMMNPEIQAIQAKYKDKKDNESMMKMQAETKAVYEKYGTSPTGGCLTMLIQLPIMFALYRVIYKVPGYVSKINVLCSNIIASIQSVGDKWSTYGNFADYADNNNKLIDHIFTFSKSQWTALQGDSLFKGIDISGNVDNLISYNNLFGINLTDAPGWKLSWALLIPILAALTQWLSAKLMENKNKAANGADANPMANSMKAMNVVMPLMSAFFCVTLPAFIGVYWITSALAQIVQQLIINKKMDHVDVEEMVQNNIDKVNAKRAKKGLPPKKITNTATNYVEQVKKQENLEARKGQIDEEIKKSTSYYNNNASKKPGSLAAKANMVKMFNEKNNKNNE